MKTIYLDQYIGKAVKIYNKQYLLIGFDSQIKETGKKRIKKKIILRDRILTDMGIVSNPVTIFDETKFEVL